MAATKVRPLEEKDIPRAVEIETAVLGGKRPSTLRGSLTAYLAKGERDACLAAEVDGKLVGFLVGDVPDVGLRRGRGGRVDPDRRHRPRVPGEGRRQGPR